MNAHWKAEEIEGLLEKYEAGATSSAEEQRLFAYFSAEAVSAAMQPEQPYFQALNELKSKQTCLSLSNETSLRPVGKRYSLAYFARLSAVAASAAAVVAVLYIYVAPKDYALIDGKKYTDKETMEQVFIASMQNVKANTQELFEDLEDAAQ